MKVNVMYCFCRMCNFKQTNQNTTQFSFQKCLHFNGFVSSEFVQFCWLNFFPEEMMCLCNALAFDSANVISCQRYVECHLHFLEDLTLLPLPFHLFCAAGEAQKFWKRVKGLVRHCQAYTQQG